MAFGGTGARRQMGSMGAGGGHASAATPPTGFVLTDIASGRLFQRTKSLTTGPVSASGTYSGGTPSAIELQVLKVSDDSVVKDWTTASSGSIGGGAWSATITGVAQGGSYYVKARPANATGLAQTGSNPFYVGALLVLYGQSFMLGLTGDSDGSPDAAAAGTTYFNGTNWAAVPAANGIRKLLNDFQSKVGIPCAALNGSVNGTPIANLVSPHANWDNLAAQIAAAGGDAEYTLWFHGSSDANSGTTAAAYVSALDGLCNDLCTLTGRTRPQMPFVLCSLATTTVADPSYPTPAWARIQTALLTAASTLSNVIYSHSMLDATLSDGLHLAAASSEVCGARFAQTLAYLEGEETDPASFFMSTGAVVDGTTSTINLTLGLGTDFTPTTGIKGFEISDDAGSTWNDCTGARASASSITLTHASIGNSRVLRYLYDKLPDISAPVLDNSALALPLCTNGTNYVSFAAAGTAPVVAAVNGTVGFNLTNNTAALPASIAAGNLLVVIAASYDQDIITPSGWNVLTTTTTAGGLRGTIFWKTASGSEGASVAMATAVATRVTSRSLRITGHRAPGTPLEASTPSSANTAAPDPAAVTPSWGGDNNLFIVAEMARSGASDPLVTAYPTGYATNQNQTSSTNGLGTCAAVATKAAIASSDDPAAFTLAGARESVAVTIAVRPA
ncbi:hypothetical protein V1279_003362 [Bradyrhizobium sp. AZCC 1610]|uniref:sialate O-acetylesterase n=1 Tax=Bradyrhizobium sp. AZCC 1610 TaxID=3117020 RepID=UPI002FF2AECE